MFTFNTVDPYVENFVEAVETPSQSRFCRSGKIGSGTFSSGFCVKRPGKNYLSPASRMRAGNGTRHFFSLVGKEVAKEKHVQGAGRPLKNPAATPVVRSSISGAQGRTDQRRYRVRFVRREESVCTTFRMRLTGSAPWPVGVALRGRPSATASVLTHPLRHDPGGLHTRRARLSRVVAKSALLRFRRRRKLRPLPGSSFPHRNRFAGFLRGPRPDRGLALLPYFLFIRSATTRAAFTPDAPA